MNQLVVLENWEKICNELKNSSLVDWNQFSSIKDKLTPQAMSDGFLLLTINSKFLCSWVKTNFLNPIKIACKNIFNRDYIIEIEIDDEDEIFSNTNYFEEDKPVNISQEKIKNSSISKVESFEVYEDFSFQNLAPSLTFSSFVIGESNRLAYSMALQVAENPGAPSLNPLFIYGKSGLGKTHLLRAIQNDLLKTKPNLKVLYTDTNDLINDYTTAAAEHDKIKMSFVTFKEKYESADVLLIDDIQFLQGKTQTLDIVFQIFNTLISYGKQIVLSADRAPKIIDIDERYTSRFLQGGTCDIQPPEHETKVAIINSFIAEYNQQSNGNKKINIPNNIINYIAECSGSNIRELKGAVTMIIYRYSLNSQNLNEDDIKHSLLNHFTSSKNNINVSDIQRVVENYYKISHQELIGKSRAKNIAYARQVAFYLCRMILDIPYIELGEKFNRDHSTVLYAVNKIEQDMLKNRNIEEEIEVLKHIIKDL